VDALAVPGTFFALTALAGPAALADPAAFAVPFAVAGADRLAGSMWSSSA
jgi:hypothetical protein